MEESKKTEVVYSQESSLGLATFRYRSKCYSFPSILVKSDVHDTPAHHTCIMLGVGQFCPTCAGLPRGHIVHQTGRLTVSPHSQHSHSLHKPDLSTLPQVTENEARTVESIRQDLPPFHTRPGNSNPSAFSPTHAYEYHTLPTRLKQSTHPQMFHQNPATLVKTQEDKARPHQVAGDKPEPHDDLWDSRVITSKQDETSDVTSDFDSIHGYDTPSLRQMEQQILQDLEILTRDDPMQANTGDTQARSEGGSQIAGGSAADTSALQRTTMSTKKPSNRSSSPEELLEQILDSLTDEVETYSGDTTLGRAFCLTSKKKQKMATLGDPSTVEDEEAGEFYNFMQGLTNTSALEQKQSLRNMDGENKPMVAELFTCEGNTESCLLKPAKVSGRLQPRVSKSQTSPVDAASSLGEDSVFTTLNNTAEGVFEEDLNHILEDVANVSVDGTSDYGSGTAEKTKPSDLFTANFPNICTPTSHNTVTEKYFSSTEALLDENSYKSGSVMSDSSSKRLRSFIFGSKQGSVSSRDSSRDSLSSWQAGIVQNTRSVYADSTCAEDIMGTYDIQENIFPLENTDKGCAPAVVPWSHVQEGQIKADNPESQSLPKTEDALILSENIDPPCAGVCYSSVEDFLPETEEYLAPPEIMTDAFQAAIQVAEIFTSSYVSKPFVHREEQNAPVQDKLLETETCLSRAQLKTEERPNAQQMQQFFASVLQSSEHSDATNKDMKSCLENKCATCSDKVCASKKERVKDEEFSTEEVTLVIAWPKKHKTDVSSKPESTFKDFHMRRVIRASDCKYSVIEGPFLHKSTGSPLSLLGDYQNNNLNCHQTVDPPKEQKASNDMNAHNPTPIKASIDVKVTNTRVPIGTHNTPNPEEAVVKRITKNILNILCPENRAITCDPQRSLEGIKAARVTLTKAARLYIDTMVDVLLAECLDSWPNASLSKYQQLAGDGLDGCEEDMINDEPQGRSPFTDASDNSLHISSDGLDHSKNVSPDPGTGLFQADLNVNLEGGATYANEFLAMLPKPDVNVCHQRQYGSLQELSDKKREHSKRLSFSETLMHNLENEVRNAASEDDIMMLITSCASELESAYWHSDSSSVSLSSTSSLQEKVHSPTASRTTKPKLKATCRGQHGSSLQPIHEGVIPGSEVTVDNRKLERRENPQTFVSSSPKESASSEAPGCSPESNMHVHQ